MGWYVLGLHSTWFTRRVLETLALENDTQQLFCLETLLGLSV